MLGRRGVGDGLCPVSIQNDAYQWDALLGALQDSHINESNDSVSWVLEKSGRYTTKSMYRYILHRGGAKHTYEENVENQAAYETKFSCGLCSRGGTTYKLGCSWVE
jgi:hypothetical protein